MDLKIETDLPNTSLDKLSGSLRPALFASSDDPDLLGKDTQHMPHLRFPQLGPLSWNGSVKPVSLALHLGTKKNELLLTDGKFNKLRILPCEGGTCHGAPASASERGRGREDHDRAQARRKGHA